MKNKAKISVEILTKPYQLLLEQLNDISESKYQLKLKKLQLKADNVDKKTYKETVLSLKQELKDKKENYKQALKEFRANYKKEANELKKENKQAVKYSFKNQYKTDYVSTVESLKAFNVLLNNEKKYIAKVYHDRETYLIDKNKIKTLEVNHHIKELKEVHKAHVKNFKQLRKEFLSDATSTKEDKVTVKRLSKSYDKLCLMKEAIKYRFKHQQILVARDIVMVFAVLNLALSLAYIRAIAQITYRVSGLLMFSFILFSLISIFNTMRLKEAYSRKFYLTVGILIAAVLMGVAMSVISLMGMRADLKNHLIQKGAFQGFIISAGLVIGIVFLFIARSKEKKEAKLNK